MLIDDSPLNLTAALERGISAATIAHPWNRDVCEEEDVLVAADWEGLAQVLEPLLGSRASAPIGAGARQGIRGHGGEVGRHDHRRSVRESARTRARAR